MLVNLSGVRRSTLVLSQMKRLYLQQGLTGDCRRLHNEFCNLHALSKTIPVTGREGL
jgi:hypothetical protein